MTATTIRLLLRGAAWPAIIGLSCCAAALGAGGVVLIDDGIGQALLTTAFAVLAAASAFALDEPCHTVVDVAPTPPAAQTAARAIATSVPLAVGLALWGATRIATPALPVATVGLALAGNVLLGFAFAVVARLRQGEPGVRASSTALLVLILPVMYGPLARHVETFPGTSTTTSGISAGTWWWLAGSASLITIAVAARLTRVT